MARFTDYKGYKIVTRYNPARNAYLGYICKTNGIIVWDDYDYRYDRDAVVSACQKAIDNNLYA